MNKFQIGILIFFGFFIVIGIIAFATYKGSSGEITATVRIWGTLPQQTFDSFVKQTPLYNHKTLTVIYTEKNIDTFDQEFVEALADGTGPDMVMLSDDTIWRHRNRLFPIPYTSYGERSFKDSFIEQGELFLTPDGILGIPITVDPLVMYWNRSVFTNASLAKPPAYWDEFLTLAGTLSKKDGSGGITQSLIPFGEWRNIINAKEIISLLMLQSGTPIVYKSGDTLKSVLASSFDGTNTIPSYAAINFYTQFANPTGPSYSWNRALPDSLTYFLSGKSALYVGFASELPSIRAKNPNLNFDAAPIPQARQNTTRIGFGRMHVLSLVKQSQVLQGAFIVLSNLITDDAIKNLSDYTYLPPVKRSLLSTKPTDAYKSVFYDSALISRSFIDPDKEKTTQIFQTMIESITSGRSSVSDAISKADESLQTIIK